jgi:hypothetical protein
MKLTREIKFGAWMAAAVLIGVGAFLTGGSLKPAEDPYYIFETDAAAHDDAVAVAAKSPGGFTGFGEVDGSASRTVIGGRVIEITAESVTLESTNGQVTTLRFGESPNVTRLVASNRDVLQTGSTVAVRLSQDKSTAEAVLVLSQP